MKIMVTGGAGFLGSHLADKLLDLGHEVLIVDNLYSGHKKNVMNLLSNPSFEFLRHDVTFPLFVEVDGIFNLACPASPLHYQKNPVQTLKTSVQGAINMLGLARRTGARILQASTSEIYGDPEFPVQDESYWGNVNSIGFRACYDEGKRAAETLFFDYHRQYSVDIRVARIFNTYGPRMTIGDGRVVSNFIVQALKGENLTVYGDGQQTRSFCFVEDMVDGLLKLFFTENIHIPINLGNPEPISMLDLAEEIISYTNSISQIEYKQLPNDDPKMRKPDISRAKELINWTPFVSRDKGIMKTIEYFKEFI